VNLAPRRRLPALEALLEQGRIIRPPPDVVRARALARARAILAATPEIADPPPSPAPGRGGLRIVFAATVAMAVGAVAAAAALQGGPFVRLASAPTPSAPPAPPDRRTAVSVGADPAVVCEARAPTSRAARAPRPGRASEAQETYAAELELLQRAQVAFASGDFVETLAIVAKHGRRFPNGRLSEEREVFRIRSLIGAGQVDQAHRAAAAFTRRFPRSVLLQRIQLPARLTD